MSSPLPLIVETKGLVLLKVGQSFLYVPCGKIPTLECVFFYLAVYACENADLKLNCLSRMFILQQNAFLNSPSINGTVH